MYSQIYISQVQCTITVVLTKGGKIIKTGAFTIRLAMLYRLAIPLLLALASATFLFRTLLLLMITVVFTGLLLMVASLVRSFSVKTSQHDRKDNNFIQSNYTIIDENDEAAE